MRRIALCLAFVGACSVADENPATGPRAAAPPGASSTTPGSTTTPTPGATPPSGDAGSDAIPTEGDFFGASRCAGSSFLLCDDFESAALDDAKWGYYPNGGTGFAKVDTTKAARGKQALHLKSPAQISAKDSWTFLADGFYLRAFMFWAQPIADHHINFFNAIQPSTGQFSVGSYDGQLAIIEYGPNNGDQGLGAKDDLPTGAWACLEWHVAPSTNEVELLMDEADIPVKNGYPFPGPTMHVTGWPPQPWSSFSIELNTAHTTDEMWVDEIAIDTKRIGCRR